jgi:hypothetical protein
LPMRSFLPLVALTSWAPEQPCLERPGCGETTEEWVNCDP